MTEAAHQMTSNPMGKHGERRPGTVGKAQGSVQVGGGAVWWRCVYGWVYGWVGWVGGLCEGLCAVVWQDRLCGAAASYFIPLNWKQLFSFAGG